MSELLPGVTGAVASGPSHEPQGHLNSSRPILVPSSLLRSEPDLVRIGSVTSLSYTSRP